MNTQETGRWRHPAVFLDKDGTLVHDVPYNVEASRIRVRAEAYEALRRLRAAGFRLVIVTNQSGVALGYFPESAVGKVRDFLREELERHGIPLDGFFYCPHGPVLEGMVASCDCRKPLPGMLVRAAKELDLDLARSWMIGDILDDVEAGNLAGCRTVLLDVGNETEWISGPHREADHRARNLTEAAEMILSSPSAPHCGPLVPPLLPAVQPL